MFCGARPALGALSFLGGLGASPVRPRRLAVLEERLVTLSNPRGCVTALCALLQAEIESRALIASVFTTLGGKFASYEQLVNSQPNGSATPGAVARLVIPAGASLRTQLGTATQRNYARAA